MSQQNAVIDPIRKYLAETLLDGDDRGLEEDTDLIRGGLLDSFAIVQFVSFLEEHFDITIPRGQIDIHSFATIRAVAALVEATRRVA